MTRKDFLAAFSIAMSGLIGIFLAIPVVGSLITPFLTEAPKKWRAIGPVQNYAVGDTVLVNFRNSLTLPWDGATSKTGAWLRRTSETEFVAFAINCTHLGCPVRWVNKGEIFLCPCHGGVFNKDGSRAGGPPNKPLNRYPVRVRKGNVEILASSLPLTHWPH